MTGTGWKKAFHPEDIDGHMEKCRDSLATGKPFENEARVRCAADGRYRWFLHRVVALRDERGDIVKWYGTASDIEDLKQAETKLRRDEEELRHITDAIPMAIMVLNPTGSSIYANRGYSITPPLVSFVIDVVPTPTVMTKVVSPVLTCDRGSHTQLLPKIS